MPDINKNATISEEQIRDYLSSNDALFIVGQSDLDNTTLINQILQYLDTQEDCVYLLLSHDISNHATDKNYSNIADHGVVEDVHYYINNVMENLPDTNLAVADGQNYPVPTLMYMMLNRANHSNKKLHVIADKYAKPQDLGTMLRRIPFKLITTATSVADLGVLRMSSRHKFTIIHV